MGHPHNPQGHNVATMVSSPTCSLNKNTDSTFLQLPKFLQSTLTITTANSLKLGSYHLLFCRSLASHKHRYESKQTNCMFIWLRTNAEITSTEAYTLALAIKCFGRINQNLIFSYQDKKLSV